MNRSLSPTEKRLAALLKLLAATALTALLLYLAWPIVRAWR